MKIKLSNEAIAKINEKTGSVIPTGNKQITYSEEARTDIDVAEYATVSIAGKPTE